jgi:hypothetical protein
MVKVDQISRLFAVYCLATVCAATKYLVINDIHLNVNATYNMPNPGEETTLFLLEIVLKNAQQQAKDEGFTYTAVLMPGDMVRHGLASYNTSLPNPNWNLMLYTM